MTKETTKICGVMGNPIKHSLSPEIFNAWFEHHKIDGDYVSLEVVDGYDAEMIVSGLLRSENFIGCNVTMPFKQRIAHGFDESGITNTIVNSNKLPVFHNTDGQGFINAIKHKYPDFDFEGKRVIIVGKGAVAESITEALDKEKATLLPFIDSRRVYYHECKVDMLINATPLGMEGYPPLNIHFSKMSKDTLICDVVTAPRETKLIKAAIARGNPYITGYDMLYEVARLTFELWFGYLPDRIENE